MYPGGIPIGVRVNSEGVLIVGYSDIEVNNRKEESPGKSGGLEIGDIILKVILCAVRAGDCSTGALY